MKNQTCFNDEFPGEGSLKKLKYIEIPLPFFYFIYTYGEPFHISVRNVVTSVQKYHGVFINKSVPFSLLFDYEMSALQRTDICAVRFTSEEISEHNILFDHNFERLKRTSSPRFVPPDFVLVDFSVKCEEELHAMSWLISECTHQYTSKHASEIDIIHNKVRISYLLSCILQTSQDVETILHASSVTSVSEKIARIIMSDYSRNWKIADLASAVLMSESSLKRKMYEEVGSINTFMHKIKLTEGLRKLRRTNIPISVISSDLGYSSPSYFSKVFFKYLNTYPQKIRQKK